MGRVVRVYDVGVPVLPRLVEASWLVSPDTSPRDAYPTYLLLVRLNEHLDEQGGWTVDLFRCQYPGQRRADRWYATESEARAALEAVYKLGTHIGTWRRPIPPSDTTPTEGARPNGSPGFRRTVGDRPSVTYGHEGARKVGPA